MIGDVPLKFFCSKINGPLFPAPVASTLARIRWYQKLFLSRSLVVSRDTGPTSQIMFKQVGSEGLSDGILILRARSTRKKFWLTFIN